MTRNSRERTFTVLFTLVLILLALTTCSSGCIKKFQQSADDAGNGDVAVQPPLGVNRTAAVPTIPPGPVLQAPVAEMTPVKSSVVTEVAPVLTVDPYPIMHGTRINDTPIENPLARAPDFTKSYHLTGNANGLLVNAVEGPLYIVFDVSPSDDCLVSPGSCRGDLNTTVNRAYMTITVRDNRTGEIVAEDGYGRMFSSDTGNYKFTYTSENADSILSSGYNKESETTTTSEPGPRYIAIYREGTFHVTIQGDYLDVNVRILTGDSPSNLEILNGIAPTRAVTDSEEDDF
jgi:hypothetical protein